MLRPDLLPDHLAERVTTHSAAGMAAGAGEFVLYWMRTAVRAHENPALDTALALSRTLQRPVFVYHALSERYPYAADRHHTFILEGARDVEAECAARGIGYAFHLERPGHRQPALRQLAERACLVITETMPVPPLDWLTDGLADQAPCPVWSVDTACVVPMPLVDKAHTRAFAFRDDTANIRRERLRRPWPEVTPAHPPFVPAALPYEPVVLATADIPALVAQCEIDHGVGPVPHTRGGSRAGYARWDEFTRSGRLDRYAAKRNDATIDGVSRMSAYFHYGMVSALRVARECAALAGDGPAKYLDELLVWRELAYAFCYWHASPTTLEGIPAWARETLATHERDHRDVLSWERLARGKTGDALWDATQQSLVRHGELHNNVRMTWGKALPLWSENAEQALERLVDLNHRYALDGRDPASYGGLLWCLGQFDRPFTPPVRVLGTVRPRPTSEHRKRLDLQAYRRRVERPAMPSAPSVLVVGAGVSGLACARTLTDHGFSVTVLEKGRGVGGRLSTRREGAWRFDHGAPLMHFGDARTRRFVQSWEQDGYLAALGDAHTGRGAMSTWPKHLAADLTVKTGVQVQQLVQGQHAGARWQVQDQHGVTHTADVLVLAIPAPQAVALLGGAPPSALMALQEVRMAPCWSTMVVFDAPPPVRLTEQLRAGELTWADERVVRCVAMTALPGRPTADAWVAQASATWSRAQLERAAEEICAEVTPVLCAHLETAGTVLHAASHRWRYARTEQGVDSPCLWSAAQGVGACGDFAMAFPQAASDVERAWLSGVAMAGRILGG
ncbi:FAD-dependent oxidoreductase [Gemmatimonas sp.]|uniref:FAD-dependent oxidoreductase n=1 Tax=Gemmatimonas sp. TaxID=1962908 RepID=UPI00391FB92B